MLLFGVLCIALLIYSTFNLYDLLFADLVQAEQVQGSDSDIDDRAKTIGITFGKFLR